MRALTLEQAIEAALHSHPQLQAARARTQAATARLGQARSIYYPQVFAQGEYVRATEVGSPTVFLSFPDLARVGSSTPKGVGEHDSLNNFIAGATVHQLLYDFGRAKGAVGAQQALEEAARMNERLAAQSVAAFTAEAFFAALSAREDVRVAAESVARTSHVREFAQAAAASGLRSPSELSRAEADEALAQLQLVRAGGSLKLFQARLAAAAGVVADAVEAAMPEGRAPAPPSEEEARASALAKRPELLALSAQQRALESALGAASAAHLPSLEASGSINLRGQFAPPAGQPDFAAWNWHAGVLLRVPLFQGFLVQERVREIEAELSALRAASEDVRQTVQLEVKGALLAISAADEAERAAQKALKAAQAALELSQTRFERGLANIIELSDAESAYATAQGAAARARLEVRSSRAILMRATGSLAP